MTVGLIARSALGRLGLPITALTLLSMCSFAQTPSVQILNTTRGGSAVFYVGDTWTVTVAGGGTYAQVVVSAFGSSSPVGTTDGSGNFTLNGYMSSAEIGTWNETWTVGGVTASPNPILFTVYPESASGCSITAGAVPPVMTSLDFIDSFSGYLTYQQLGSGTVSGVLDPAGFCLTYADTWTIPDPMSGQRTMWTNLVDRWQFWDNGGRPTILNGFYPFYTGSVVGMVSVNVTNGNFWYATVPIGLYIDYAWW